MPDLIPYDSNLDKLPDEIITIGGERLTKEQLVWQLQSYGCPNSIVDSLKEWILECYLDNLKLGKWNESQGIE